MIQIYIEKKMQGIYFNIKENFEKYKRDNQDQTIQWQKEKRQKDI